MPHLLRLLEEHDVETEIYTQAYLALAQWGSDILEDVLRFAATADRALYPGIGAILSESGKGDARAYTWVKARFDEERNEHGIRYWAEMLLELGGEEAITHLENRILTKRRYSPYLRRVLTGYIQNVRERGRL